MNHLNDFISLTNNGILRIKNQLKYAFDQYKIFIEAKNEANINSSSASYLVDMSVYNMA